METAEKYALLPQSSKDLMFSAQWTDELTHIAAEQHLTSEQTSLLEAAAVDIMLGNTELLDSAKMISNLMEVDISIGETLAQELDVRLFSKVKEVAHRSPDTETAKEEATTTAPISTTPYDSTLAVIDQRLTEPTVTAVIPTTSNTMPPPSTSYKTDPYREPLS